MSKNLRRVKKMFKTVKEYLDYMIKLDVSPEEIMLIFENEKEHLKNGFIDLLQADKEYQDYFKGTTKDTIEEHLKKVDYPEDYFNIYNVRERLLVKELWNNRAIKYGEFKGKSKQDIWDEYMDNPNKCEDEMYDNVLKELYGNDFDLEEFNNMEWVKTVKSNKEYDEENPYIETEGLVWDIISRLVYEDKEETEPAPINLLPETCIDTI